MNLNRVDWLLAVALAVVVCACACLFAYPLPRPGLWEPLAVAAGLRPPAHALPGLWNALAGGLFRHFGAPSAMAALGVLGKVVLGALAACAYLLLRELVTSIHDIPDRLLGRFRLLDRTVSVLGAWTFVCAPPVWRLGQTLGPDGLALFGGVLCVLLFLRVARHGEIAAARVLWPLLGVLAAEGPWGVLLTVLAVSGFGLIVRGCAIRPQAWVFFDPLVLEISAWRATLLFLLGFGCMVALNVHGFVALQGLAAAGRTPLSMLWDYLSRQVNLVCAAATSLGWVLMAGCSAIPCAVAVARAPRSRDEDALTSYRTGLLYLVLLFAGFVPLIAWTGDWWSLLSAPGPVRSPLLRAGTALLSAVTFAQALSVLGTDLFCRNIRRIALTRNPELLAESGRQLESLLTAASRWRLPLLLGVPSLVVVFTLPGVWQMSERRVLSCVDEFVQETLRETGEAGWIFTDGALDALLELRSAQAGRTVRAVSMLSTQEPRDVWIRRRGARDEEDRELLRAGAWETVRAWALEKPARAGDFVVQAGFEAWQRARREVPACGGFAVHPRGTATAASVAAANGLADRILALWRGGLSPSSVEARVLDAFLFVQWRLSRLARLRARAAERAGNPRLAERELSLADRLDACNPAARRVQAHNDWMRRQRGEGLTPREGLRLALDRADFGLARRYAQPILNADPADPQANFACGMACFVEKRYAQAEQHLKRMLERAPNEAAAWNNLAAIYLRTGRLEEAVSHVAKARELAPDAVEVQALLRQIEAARLRAPAR